MAADNEGVIVTGSTVSRAQLSFHSMNYNVKFMGIIENFTDTPLIAHETQVVKGYVQNPIGDILPGMSEAFAGHKEGFTATGCAGTLAWRIGQEDLMLTVLYSVPFDQNIYKNKLGIGIQPLGHTQGMFKDFYKTNTDYDQFVSKKFASDICPIDFIDSHYKVKGQMGNSHSPIIQIQLYPRQEKNLAPDLKL